jgi:hypothetical protein
MYPYVVVQGIKALRLWSDFCHARGQELQPLYYQNNDLWKMRCQELDAYSMDKSTPTPPPTLKDDWRTFEELFTTYLSQIRSNLCGIPLTYVIKDKVDPDEDEMDLDDYDSIDACLVATSTLTHSSYCQGNTKVFDLLKPLIYSETSRY